jgi:hypothetical protein
VANDFINADEAEVLDALRERNALLFDFVLKRSMRVAGRKLSPIVFESRRVFV